MLIYYGITIILLGIITSYEDIKKNKIRNKIVLSAITIGIILNSISYYQKAIGTQYLYELITNVLITIIAAFAIWNFGLWSAGDGKLFIAYSVLIPLSFFRIGYQKYFPSITLLINTYIPLLIIMLIYVIVKAKKKDRKKRFKEFIKGFFDMKKTILSIIYLLAFLWIISLALIKIGVDNYMLMLFLTILIYYIIQRKLGKKTLYIAIIIMIIRLATDKSIYSINFLKELLMLFIVWKLLYSFLQGALYKLAHDVFSYKISTSKLKPGMILSDDINLDIDEEAEGLTRKQIETIKRSNIEEVKISQTMPFAVFMFLGTIITMIVEGNVIIYLIRLI